MSATYEPVGYCPKCGYRMDAGTCPECGKAVARPAKRDPRAIRTRLRRLGRWFTLSVIVVAVLYYGGGHAVYAWWPTKHRDELSNRKDWLGARAGLILSWRWDREEARAKRRSERIEAELEGLRQHDWAGNYGGESTSLIIAPKSGFVRHSYGCMGPWLDSHGEIVRTDSDVIEVRHTLADTELFHWSPGNARFYRVLWGARRMLFPESYLAIWALDPCGPTLESLHHWALCRERDLEMPVYGLPELPAQYRTLLPPPPCTFKIRTVDFELMYDSDLAENGDYAKWRVVATIDGGINEGLDDDSILWGLFADFPRIRVEEAADGHCVIGYSVLAVSGEPPLVAQPGWEVVLDTDFERRGKPLTVTQATD